MNPDEMEPTVAAASRPRPLGAHELRQMGVGLPPRKSRALYIALGIFFGLFGAHNFYAGRYVAAVCQLGLLLTVSWWLPLILLGLFLWVVAELVLVKPK